MLGLSGIYALLAAPFLAVVQILVYAGAVMMLVVFVIMILNGAKDANPKRFASVGIIGLIIPVVLGLLAAAAMTQVSDVLATAAQSGAAPVGEPQAIAQQMFDLGAETSRGYYLLFEIVGLVLLVAVVGAVMLAKRDLASPQDSEDSTPVAGGGH